MVYFKKSQILRKISIFQRPSTLRKLVWDLNAITLDNFARSLRDRDRLDRATLTDLLLVFFNLKLNPREIEFYLFSL